MKHPPYHLRPNKAIDRLLFLEVVQEVCHEWDLSHYVYYGFGGPFLQDVRLMCQKFPEMRYVSVERDQDTHKRQKSHACTKRLSFINNDFGSFLKQEFRSQTACIVWLDYNDLKPKRIEEFAALLELVGAPSVVRVTLRASVDSSSLAAAKQFLSERQVELVRQEWLARFQRRYGDYLAEEVRFDELGALQSPRVIQSMLEITAQKILPEIAGTVFQVIHSCTYADGPHKMLSVTGVVCKKKQRSRICEALKVWPHRNTDWSDPEVIDLPDLSVKERLILEKGLPTPYGTGKALQRTLGYKIDKSDAASARKLRQYKEFYRFAPLFARIGV